LEIESISSPSNGRQGDFTSNHIRVLREIPIEEVKAIFKEHYKVDRFDYAEKEVRKNKEQKRKSFYQSLISFFIRK